VAMGFRAKIDPIAHSQIKVRKTEGNAEEWCRPENVPLVPVCWISRPIARSLIK
jgi:hypothetical protein